MSAHTKQKRRESLRGILEDLEIGDQNCLLQELEKQGIETTQATISRDLHEMGYVKVPLPSGMYKYQIIRAHREAEGVDRLREMFRNLVVDVRCTNNLILVKTEPGNANGIASLIDGLGRRDILGTVAGDDTILVVVDGDAHGRALREEFEGLLHA